MIERTKRFGVAALVVMLACTPGEAPPPAGPGAEPGTEPAPSDPVEAPAAGDIAVEERASELLTESQLAYESGDIASALEGASRVVSEYGGTGAALPARWVAARAAFALGRYEESRSQAEAYASQAGAGLSTAEAARELAELAVDAQASPAAAPVVVGAVLSRTGPRVLVRYAEWVLEGIELAVAEAEEAQGREIELVVADDAGGDRVREAVREVESRGAVAVIGPLLPQNMAAAAGARRDSRLVLISPTATDEPRWSESYSVSAPDARGAQELGRYAADVGLAQAAVLYPRLPEYERKAQGFAVEYEQLGGVVRAMVPYDSGTTTFGPHMNRILEAVAPVDTTPLMGVGVDSGYIAPVPPAADSADPWHNRAPQEPFALFVPAPQRDVPQIAPQVSFYGLDSAGVQVFGDEAWASAPVRRLVPDRDLEGVIAASHFPPDRASGPADPDFIRAYETRYRKSLETTLPAMGYDAAHLIAQALPNRLLTPAALSRRFGLLAGVRGATGLLSVRGGRLVRTSYVVEIRGGRLVPAPYPWEYRLPVPTPPLPPDTAETENVGGGGR